MAVDRYFVGNGTTNVWNSTACWSTESGGTGGASIPVSIDTAYFDSNSPDCTIEASDEDNHDVYMIDTTGYANTITATDTNIVSNIINLINGTLRVIVSISSIYDRTVLTNNFTISGSFIIENNSADKKHVIIINSELTVSSPSCITSDHEKWTCLCKHGSFNFGGASIYDLELTSLEVDPPDYLTITGDIVIINRLTITPELNFNSPLNVLIHMAPGITITCDSELMTGDDGSTWGNVQITGTDWWYLNCASPLEPAYTSIEWCDASGSATNLGFGFPAVGNTDLGHNINVFATSDMEGSGELLSQSPITNSSTIKNSLSSGYLLTANSITSGSGTNTDKPPQVGTGNLLSSSSTITGTATQTAAPMAVGNLISSSCTISGSAFQISNNLATGNLINQSPSTTGSAYSFKPGHASLLIESAEIRIFPNGDGILVPSSLISTGSGSLTHFPPVGSGELLASSTIVAAIGKNALIPLYFSVGRSTDNLMTGSPTVTIANGVATFSEAQVDNIGMGDVMIYDTDQRCFLTYKLTNNSWQIVTKIGNRPSNIYNSTVVSIKRCFEYLDDAVGSSGGVPYVTGITSEDFIGSTDFVHYNVKPIIVCYNDGSADTKSVVISGLTTGPENILHILVPNINDDGVALPSDNKFDIANNIQSSPDGLPNTGYCLVSNDLIGIQAIDINIAIQNLDISGTCGTAIRLEASTEEPSKGIVRNSIIHNTGDYGIFSAKELAQHETDIYGCIVYGQSTSNITHQSNGRMYVANNLIDHEGIGIDATNGTLDMEFNLFLGSSTDVVLSGTTIVNNWCNAGSQTDLFTPSETPGLRRNQILTDYNQVFNDVSGHDYRIKVGSAPYLAGLVEGVITTMDTQFKHDLAGSKRSWPEITIGPLEIPPYFEFDGSQISGLYEDAFIPVPSIYGYDVFINKDKTQFPRISSRLESWETGYYKEKKILINLKDVVMGARVSYLDYEILYEFDALFEYKLGILSITKQQAYNSGIFSRMVGDRGYVFLYDEKVRKLKVGFYPQIDQQSGKSSVMGMLKK